MGTPKTEPVAWHVCSVNGDGTLSLEHACAWEEAAHQHINEAITEHGIEDAASWVVRPVVYADQPKKFDVSISADPRLLERAVKAETELGLQKAVDDWVKGDASRFRWLMEDHADPGARQAARDLLGRLGAMSYSAACDAIDSARRECAQREELMSVSKGRKVGELTRKIRRQQTGRG